MISSSVERTDKLEIQCNVIQRCFTFNFQLIGEGFIYISLSCLQKSSNNNNNNNNISNNNNNVEILRVYPSAIDTGVWYSMYVPTKTCDKVKVFWFFHLSEPFLLKEIGHFPRGTKIAPSIKTLSNITLFCTDYPEKILSYPNLTTKSTPSLLDMPKSYQNFNIWLLIDRCFTSFFINQFFFSPCYRSEWRDSRIVWAMDFFCSNTCVWWRHSVT